MLTALSIGLYAFSAHNLWATPPNTSDTSLDLSSTLRSGEDSYQIAASVFLPEALDEDYSFSGSKLEESHETSLEKCNGFDLSSCPAHAICLKCSFDNKYKFSSCQTNYKKSGTSCVAKSCSEINSAYRADVPSNQICSIVSTPVSTCYQSCRNIDFSAYPLDICPSGASCKDHPDCTSTSTQKANCTVVKKKITGCPSSQKINAAGTACIAKDDTCPANYYKTCDTGTQGDPKYTELGTACYQCKPAQECDVWGKYYFNDNSVHNIVAGQCGLAIYGQNPGASVAAGGVTMNHLVVTAPSGSTFSGGPLTINGNPQIGTLGGGMVTTVTFNNAMTINGDVYLHGASKLIFNKGLSGNYKCYDHASKALITCPFTIKNSSGSLIPDDNLTPIKGCPNNLIDTTCNGIKYCCPSGVTCASMKNGGIQCFTEAVMEPI